MNLREWMEKDSRVGEELENLLKQQGVDIGNLKQLRKFIDCHTEVFTKIKILDVWRNDRIKDIKIIGEEEIRWAYLIIDEEEMESITENMEAGNRYCLYGEPELGKVLLINYEDGSNVVVDSIKDIEETVLGWEDEE